MFAFRKVLQTVRDVSEGVRQSADALVISVQQAPNKATHDSKCNSRAPSRKSTPLLKNVRYFRPNYIGPPTFEEMYHRGRYTVWVDRSSALGSPPLAPLSINISEGSCGVLPLAKKARLNEPVWIDCPRIERLGSLRHPYSSRCLPLARSSPPVVIHPIELHEVHRLPASRIVRRYVRPPDASHLVILAEPKQGDPRPVEQLSPSLTFAGDLLPP